MTTATHLCDGKRYPINEEADLVSLLPGLQQCPRASVIGVEGGGLVVLGHRVPAVHVITGNSSVCVCVCMGEIQQHNTARGKDQLVKLSSNGSKKVFIQDSKATNQQLVFTNAPVKRAHLVWPLTCCSPDPAPLLLSPELSPPDPSLALSPLRVAASFWGVFSLFLVLLPWSLRGGGGQRERGGVGSFKSFADTAYCKIRTCTLHVYTHTHTYIHTVQ